ncbi:hypothetical protein [Chloroflexus aggregans]|uniref:DUF218 domain-containing protein n=1 Tax=Chloroflexus aggregans (strain MD-66 / DSM 9485) TaxID=326427 RepID=B8GBT9_CHLAD|nr:hypothetical protein [Chloroflexus aggregans]ACL24906.1 hypothetical protein Cagg_2018 [Chloroflexus aggregans DSM 9485]
MKTHNFWLQSLRSVRRWLLGGIVIIAAITLWVVDRPLAEPFPLSADAVLVVATAPPTVEMSAQLADLLNTGAVPVAYLAGPNTEALVIELNRRGVSYERLRILDDTDQLLSTAHTSGLRRLMIAAPFSHRLMFVRQAQTMGFAVAALDSGAAPTLSERVTAALLYWRMLLLWRAF